MLASTTANTTERDPSGASEGGVSGGGIPERYGFDARGYHALSPWNNTAVKYSILQIALGSNPNSNLEVVSMLNVLSQANAMYYVTKSGCLEKYNPKVYFGTLLDVAPRWIMDYSHGSENDPISGWPQAFQGGQKGEAIINFVCNLMLLIIRFGSDKPIVNDNQTF